MTITADVLLGSTVPRLWTRPLVTGPEGPCGCGCPLTPETTLGFDFLEFCAEIGADLMPHQRWLAIHALELSPDGRMRFRTCLVLMARQNGKTTVKRLLSLWRLYRRGAELVVGTAQDLALAREQMYKIIGIIQGNKTLRAGYGSVRKTLGNEYFWLGDSAAEWRPGQPRYMIKALTESGRGFDPEELSIDELRTQTDWDGYAAISKTTSAQPHGQNWLMSNAGDDDSVVLNRLQKVARSGVDESMFLAEWSAEDDCPLDDVGQILFANPGTGRRGPSMASIRSSMLQDDPFVYRTEVLCQRVPSMRGVIPMQEWRASVDASSPSMLGRKVALFVEVADDLGHASLMAGALLDGGRVQVETVAVWDSTEALRRDLPEWRRVIRPRRFGWWGKGPAVALGNDLRRVCSDELGPEEEPEACSGLKDLVEHHLVIHNGDQLVERHLRSVERENVGGRWRFKRKGAAHIDAAYATAGVVHLARQLGRSGHARTRFI